MSVRSIPSSPAVAIVGATGAVGIELIQCLAKRDFPVGKLRLLASPRSAGRQLEFRGSMLPVEELGESSFEGVDIALFSAGGAIFRRFGPIAVASGAVATYQAASGAGAAGMEELRESTRAYLENRPFAHSVFPHPYAFNAFSHNSSIDPVSLYNEEETKVMRETRKILADESIRVSATCVRLVDDPASNCFPMPLDAAGQDAILAGRIRQDASDQTGRSVALFVAGDQLLKGAALNAVQIAELLVGEA